MLGVCIIVMLIKYLTLDSINKKVCYNFIDYCWTVLNRKEVENYKKKTCATGLTWKVVVCARIGLLGMKWDTEIVAHGSYSRAEKNTFWM